MKFLWISLFIFISLGAGATTTQSYSRNREGLKKFGEKSYYPAFQEFSRALEDDPLNPVLHLNIARAFEANEEFEKAEQGYQGVLKVLPENSELRFQALFNLALAAPRTQFIFAHMGGMEFRFWNILALVRTAENLFADNVYFDISGTVLLAAGSPLQDEFVWTLRNVGIDRVLVGSDYPQIGLGRKLTLYDRSLDMHVSHLRRKLQRLGYAGHQLHTVWGKGYVLTPAP